ncbi:MAG TPA: methyltransferase domain-containing protein [Nocardioidaceae bacterium]|nr:methyltransferase domain-containing protein [Nocardioidaceae bacterium]
MRTVAVRDLLPAATRRRLGRIKRAVLDQPGPPTSADRTGKKAERRRRGPLPGVAPDSAAALPRLELRRNAVLSGQDADCLILEIGPAHNAILPKRDGYRTKTLDHLDRDGLVVKYRADKGVDGDLIEPVDYVVSPGTSLAEMVSEQFDVVVASHVLEHTTSVIDFLNDCAKLLKPDGHVALVIPDYRFCFDRFRERSSLGRVIDASESRRDVHSVGTVTEFAMEAVTHGGVIAWAPGHRGRYSRLHDTEDVRRLVERARAQAEYVDVHNWVFSPNHLRLLLHDLATLGYIDLWEKSFHPTVQHEFFINLSPSGSGVDVPRHRLVQRADAELRSLDSSRWRPVDPDARSDESQVR